MPKIISTGLKVYNISWSQPRLPGDQTVLQYNVNYGVSKDSNSIARNSIQTFVIVRVEYNKWYTVEVQVETQAGQSAATTKSWLTHSSMFYHRRTTGGIRGVAAFPLESFEFRKIEQIFIELYQDSGNFC